VTERDNAVRVYDVATGERRHAWTLPLTNPNENYTSAVAFSPDGRTLVAGATDHLIHRRDLRAGREAAPLRGHTGYVTALVFAADGRWLYSSGWDGSIRRWDTATWQAQPVVPDAATGTVAVWEAQTGQRVLQLAGHPAGRSSRDGLPDPPGRRFLRPAPLVSGPTPDDNLDFAPRHAPQETEVACRFRREQARRPAARYSRGEPHCWCCGSRARSCCGWRNARSSVDS
jgi:hypothetical protein